MNKLTNKKILVTGGATGIGLAVVRELAKHRAMIGIHYCRSVQAATELKSELAEAGVAAETFQADLTDPAQAKKLSEAFAKWAGGMDILINNAGDILGRKTLDQQNPEFVRRVMAVNLDSAVLVTQSALPYLKAAGKTGGASIVNMSSLAARTGAGTGASVYSAAKAAVLTWTKAMARELAADGIRVNAVAPGLILETSFHETHTPKTVQAQIIDSIPLKRPGRPADVARAIAYLASEYDGFITGAVLDINGGVW